MTEADGPQIDWFPATDATAAVAVFPGGGYHALAPHEGEPVARWLNSLGVSAAVVRYRRADTGRRHPTPLNDALVGVRFCREHARVVGVLGFSAGGHLAATCATATDEELAGVARPDFAVLCYPVVDLAGPFAHRGSRDNLLGPGAADDLASSLSAQNRVTPRTPPTFVFHTSADPGVPVENALMFAAALRENGVSFALHVVDDSARPDHGNGLGDATSVKPDPLAATWTAHCAAWLRSRGWAT